MSNPVLNRPISVAPMMDRTDLPFRILLRHITRASLLYTEMITTRALLSGRAGPYHAPVDALEGPVAFQLGGDDPAALGECAKIVEDLGYDEVNLNVGCPSSRVQHGRIGAVLMREPQHVSECLSVMRSKVSIPVTVKHRLGVDEDPDEALRRFVELVAPSGVRRFIVHARKAWLEGLSPKENRTVPPLRYELVHELAACFPDLHIELNGGVQDLSTCAQLMGLDRDGSTSATPGALGSHEQAHKQPRIRGVMLGRAVWDHPMLLAPSDLQFYGQDPPGLQPEEIAQAMIPVMEHTESQGRARSFALRPVLNLFHGRPGGRSWRRVLSQGAAASRQEPLSALVRRALDTMHMAP